MTNKPFDDQVIRRFCTDPSLCTVTPLGHGNINDTYLVQSAAGAFVLQRLNSTVFPQPLHVIENFQKVTAHLAKKVGRPGEQIQLADPVYTLRGDLFYRDSAGGFWRGQTYLPHAICSVLTEGAQAHQVGRTLATFHLLLNDLDIHSLSDPLPGFHNLPLYIEEFDRVYQKAKGAEKKEDHSCVEKIDYYRERTTTLEKAKDGGILRVQPIHGDPKLDNFITDNQGKVVGLLDLDTVGAGLIHYDLGDCLRSCCNQAGEKAAGDKLISFNLDICKSLLAGYFSASDELLSKEQRSYIFDGLLQICFELGLRFYTDHLRGNSYFKVAKDGDNLLRAINQFRLTDDIAKKEEKIRAMVMDL